MQSSITNDKFWIKKNQTIALSVLSTQGPLTSKERDQHILSVKDQRVINTLGFMGCMLSIACSSFLFPITF